MTRANRVQACAIFGLSRHEFDEAVLAGFPAVKRSASRGEDWSIDLAAGHKWLLNRALAEAGLAASGEAPLDLEQQRARLAKEQADKLQREREIDEGELLVASEVKAALVKTFASVNSRLGAMPATLAHRVNPGDPRAARRVLELAVEECRAELRGIRIGTDAAA